MTSLERIAIDSIKRIYRKYPSGGALHIVIDDFNVADSDIYWCIENSIRETTKDKGLFELCAINLMKLQTETKRSHCIAIAWEEYKNEEKEN